MKRRFIGVQPFSEEEEEDEVETSFAFLWLEMAEDGFVVDGEKTEKEEIQALYLGVCAALDRQKGRVTAEVVIETVEEVVRGQPLSPERHAQTVYAAEWYARQAFPGHRDPGRFPRPGRRTFRRDRFLALFEREGEKELPRDPAEFALFPSPEEVGYALRLTVPPTTVHEVYGAVAGIYRTFGVSPDFPTLIERLQQNPGSFRAGYAPIWYVWKTVIDLHFLIRDRMQEVFDAAGR